MVSRLQHLYGVTHGRCIPQLPGIRTNVCVWSCLGSRWQRQWNSGDHILANVHDSALAVEPASESDLRAGQPANTWLHPRQVRIRPSRGAADLLGLLWLIRWKCENVQPTLEVENRKPTLCTEELLTSWLCVAIQLDRQYTKQAEQYTDLTAHLNHPHSFSEIKVNNDHVWFRSQPDPRKQLIRTCTEYAGPRHTSHPKHVKPPFSNIQILSPAQLSEKNRQPCRSTTTISQQNNCGIVMKYFKPAVRPAVAYPQMIDAVECISRALFTATTSPLTSAALSAGYP